MRQINEPIVVGSSVETYPDVLSRNCCLNCGDRNPKSQIGDTTIGCVKHHRVTLAWWWCSDYLSDEEKQLREEAYASLDKTPIPLGTYLQRRTP